MEFRKYDHTYYIRMDTGDKIIASLLDVCRKEKIPSAVFSGIGGSKRAEIQIFDPAAGAFGTRELEGTLELIALNGNVICDENGELFHHTHALFSFEQDGLHETAGNKAGEVQNG